MALLSIRRKVARGYAQIRKTPRTRRCCPLHDRMQRRSQRGVGRLWNRRWRRVGRDSRWAILQMAARLDRHLSKPTSLFRNLLFAAAPKAPTRRLPGRRSYIRSGILERVLSRMKRNIGGARSPVVRGCMRHAVFSLWVAVSIGACSDPPPTPLSPCDAYEQSGCLGCAKNGCTWCNPNTCAARSVGCSGSTGVTDEKQCPEYRQPCGTNLLTCDDCVHAACAWCGATSRCAFPGATCAIPSIRDSATCSRILDAGTAD